MSFKIEFHFLNTFRWCMYARVRVRVFVFVFMFVYLVTTEKRQVNFGVYGPGIQYSAFNFHLPTLPASQLAFVGSSGLQRCSFIACECAFAWAYVGSKTNLRLSSQPQFCLLIDRYSVDHAPNVSPK